MISTLKAPLAARQDAVGPLAAEQPPSKRLARQESREGVLRPPGRPVGSGRGESLERAANWWSGPLVFMLAYLLCHPIFSFDLIPSEALGRLFSPIFQIGKLRPRELDGFVPSPHS
jgi:hypothetical protein